MIPDEMERRAQALLNAEADDPLLWWYLSFAEDKPPNGRGFLGGVFIKARGFMSAYTGASMVGLNPGGEVAGRATPYTDDEAGPWSGRLLTRDEVINLPEPAATTEEP